MNLAHFLVWYWVKWVQIMKQPNLCFHQFFSSMANGVCNNGSQFDVGNVEIWPQMSTFGCWCRDLTTTTMEIEICLLFDAFHCRFLLLLTCYRSVDWGLFPFLTQCHRFEQQVKDKSDSLNSWHVLQKVTLILKTFSNMVILFTPP